MPTPFADQHDAWSAPLSDITQLKPRGRASASLSVDKFLRGLGRQWLFFMAVGITAFSAGAAYAYATQSTEALWVWGAFGVGVGFAAALSRELSRDTIGAVSSLRRLSGFDIIGATPELARHELRALSPDLRGPRGATIYFPASPYAASIRDLTAGIGGAQIVAFCGAIPNQGATSTALCFALAAAQEGRKVVILDCDVRRRSLTRELMPEEPAVGMMEVSAKPDILPGVVEFESETGLPFIPATQLRNHWRTMLNQDGLRTALSHLRTQYDLIVLDCPPSLTSADSGLIARHADKRIVVAAWDETPVGALRATVRAFRHQPPIPTAICLNRVPRNYRLER